MQQSDALDDRQPTKSALVRSHERDAGLARVRHTLDRFRVARALGESNILCGDLTDLAGYAGDARLREVTHVIHAGAIACFSPHPQLHAVNVAGTLALARRLAQVSRLDRFVHVGTAMACGTGHGRLIEEFVPCVGGSGCHASTTHPCAGGSIGCRQWPLDGQSIAPPWAAWDFK